jgi:hypothetical protein
MHHSFECDHTLTHSRNIFMAATDINQARDEDDADSSERRGRRE